MEKQKIRIDGQKLKETLEQFAGFGKTENGGVTRLSLTDEDRKARDYFTSYCKELGMTIAVDDIGNMYGTVEGEEKRPPILIGSHLDSVKKGGRFDGVLGVACGLEIARTFVENKIKPKVPITIVNFTNEEGARFEPSMMSSGILSGKFDEESMFAKKDEQGITFREALKEIGYDGNRESRLKDAHAFLELHIEQGPILEHEQISIGVVECVVGMVCYEVTVSGESNHAGTTPMRMRNDAFFEAVDVIQSARKALGTLDSELVYTIGRVNVYPNIHTVIPNKVVFTVEARHENPEVIRQVEEIINGLGKSNGQSEVTINKLWGRDTVRFDQDICKRLEEAAEGLGFSNRRMVSGAGHDAQFIAASIPTAMVFVPSTGGKSHCENEYTSWEECEKGVNVLLETVMQMQSEQ